MTYKHHVIPFHEWKRRINSKATRYNKEFNASDNVVWLTLEQHIQVHQLLFELNGSEYDRIAHQSMSGLIGEEEVSRLALIEMNKQRTKEQRTEIAKKLVGNSHSLGHRNNSEVRKRMSDARKGIGYKIIYTTVTCPHCGKSGGSNCMPRWHFNNCKEKR